MTVFDLVNELNETRQQFVTGAIDAQQALEVRTNISTVGRLLVVALEHARLTDRLAKGDAVIPDLAIGERGHKKLAKASGE